MIFFFIAPSPLGILASSKLQAATCSLSLNPSPSPLQLTEGAGPVSISVTLVGCPGAEDLPQGDISLTITDQSPSLAGLTIASSGVISRGAPHTPATISLTVLDDFIPHEALSDGTLTIGVSDHNSGDTIIPAVLQTVAYVDNDIPALLSSSTALALISAPIGGRQSTSFTLRLSTIPSKPVSVVVTGSSKAHFQFNPPLLTFDEGSWSLPQTITVASAGEEITRMLSETLSLRISSDDPHYQTLAPTQIPVHSSPGRFIFSKTELATSFAGASDRVNLSLGSAPREEVVVSISPHDPEHLSVQTPSLRFTPSTWQIPQEIIVTGNEDESYPFTLVSSLDFTVSSLDTTFTGAPPPALAIRQSPALISFGRAEFVLSTAGGVDAVGVRLLVAPTAAVTLTLANSQAPLFTLVAPQNHKLTFTPENWDQAQLITIGSPPEKKLTIDSASLAIEVNSDDVRFDKLTLALAIRKVPERFVVSTTSLHTDDSGAATTLRVQLAHQPTSQVQLKLSRNTVAWVTLKPHKVYFSPTNWQTPQTITIRGIVGEIASPQLTEISLISDSDDPLFQNYRQAKALVVTHELSRSLAFSGLTGALANQESASFTLALKKAPSQNLTIRSAADNELLRLDPSELLYTADNWSRPQRVTIHRINPALALPQSTLSFTPSLREEFSPLSATLAALPARAVSQGTNTALHLSQLNFNWGFYRRDQEQRQSVKSAGELAIHAGEEVFLDLSLSQQPLAPVQVRVSIPLHQQERFALGGEDSDPLQLVHELIFTPEDWYLPQAITVAALALAANTGFPQPLAYLEMQLTSADAYYNEGKILSPPLSLRAAAAQPLSGCFIATAAFQNPQAAELTSLRWFRDHILLQISGGKQLVAAYYALGPGIAARIAPFPLARFFVRSMLYPLIGAIEFPWLAVLLALSLILMTRKRA